MTQDQLIREVLVSVKTIALVGWSPKPERASHRVANYLTQRGYRVIPVNPGQVGVIVNGEPVRGALSDITEGVDMVDIFRNSAEAGGVVDAALAAFPDLRAVWMQLGVIDAEAAARAQAAGVVAIMDRCPAIEIPRLGL